MKTRDPRGSSGVPLLAILLVVTWSCHRGAEQESDSTAATVAVRTAVATARSFVETVAAIGDVEPRPGHVAALGAPAATRVTQVFVTAGQHVAAGDRLVQLDQSVFEASVRSADAAVDAAQRNFDRQQRLVQAGIAPRKDLDQASSDLAQAKAALVTAQRELSLATLRSPIRGVVTKMSAVLGSPVDANELLVEVADPSAADVVLEVTPADAARLRVGASVRLRAGQTTAGDTLGGGTVVDVGGIVDSASRSVGVRVRPGVTRRVLRIGETVTGDLTIAVHPHAVTVPDEALVPEGEGFKVFVVDSANVAHERPVKLGGRGAGVAWIADGISAGDRVVTYGAYGISDGATVTLARP